MNNSLKAPLKTLWNALLSAGTTPGHGLRNITIAHHAGTYVNAYTVVLRDASETAGSLTFFTDLRSPKVEQIKTNPHVTVCGYDAGAKMQLIVQGIAYIHYQDEQALHYWKKEGRKSRQSYLAKPAPSTIIAQPDDGLSDFRQQGFKEQDMAGYENFAVVTIQAQQLEYLQLDHDGNKRAQFTRQPDTGWQGNWLIP